jgi:dTDP-4-dehydrorhamnose reductase
LLRENIELIAFTREMLDIRDAKAFWDVLPDCDVVINAAAYTNVDACELDVPEACEVNGWALRKLGQITAERGIRLIHYSTDFVFSGRLFNHQYVPHDNPNPINTYGYSKLVGEREIRLSNPKHVIIRTQGLFGFGGSNFVQTMFNRALKGKETRVVINQVGRVTYAPDLVELTYNVLKNPDVPGIIHFANAGILSKHKIAFTVFRRLGVENLVKPCTTRDYITLAVRPPYAPLDITPFGSEISGEDRILTYVDGLLLTGLSDIVFNNRKAKTND